MTSLFKSGLLGATIIALSAGAAFADYSLTILHTNDFHSRIEAINKYDSTCSTEEAGKNECFGGIARMKTAIDTARAAVTSANGNVLVLDAGDQFQGSLFYSTYKSKLVAEFMNGMGYDAMAVGNHEWDDGPEELAKLITESKFPIISGNTVAGANTPVAGKIKAYEIKEVGGQKIAILSVLATDSDETSSPGPSVFFTDEISYLKTTVKEIEAQGINKIVLVSHVGYLKDQEIAKAVDGIDVIVGGHSHTLLSNKIEGAAGPYPIMVKSPSGTNVPVVTAYAYSKYLGELTLVFDDAGKVKTASGEPKLLDSTVMPDPVFAARVKELGAPIEALKNTIVAQSTDTIDGSRETCRAVECAMGNLVADAMLDSVKNKGITIAIQNGGGVRASIDQGPISMGEVLTVLPFQNTVATFQLKGSDVVASLESGLAKIEEGAGRFPQVAGLKYTFDRSKPVGSRILSVEVASGSTFVKINPDTVYGLVTNNYTRTGGDGFKLFASNGMNSYDFGPSLEDTVARYLAANSPYKPYVDGRITVVGTAVAAPAEAMESAKSTAVIVKGDTFWALAGKYYGDPMLWSKLTDANPSIKPTRMVVGAEITIPAK